jgi:hypothetical protein
MRLVFVFVGVCLGAFTNIAIAEVTAAGEGGFSLEHEVLVDSSREDAWQAAVEKIGLWWSDDHTISGKAAAMSIDARPLGCFCEAVGNDGGVVHLVVTSVNRNVMLRMTGALGPLGLMGVDGNMTWEFFDADEGTRVRFAYAVGGYYPGGLDTLAAPVNGVIGEALQRLKAFIETGDANTKRGE